MNNVLDDLRAAADYQIRMSGSASDYLLEAENEIKRLRAEIERMRALLKDPNAVAINMLRGVIALPSAAQIRHIYQQTPEAEL